MTDFNTYQGDPFQSGLAPLQLVLLRAEPVQTHRSVEVAFLSRSSTLYSVMTQKV